MLPVWLITPEARQHAGEAVLSGSELTITLEPIPHLQDRPTTHVPYWLREAERRKRSLTPWERQSLKQMQRELERRERETQQMSRRVSERPGEEALRGVVHLTVSLPPGAGLNRQRLAEGEGDTSLIAVASVPNVARYLWIEGRPDIRTPRTLHILLNHAPPAWTFRVQPARPEDPVTPRLALRQETLPPSVLERQAQAEHRQND